MRGYFCQRKAGWDTHGLPVEVEVSKELGIHAKDEIENYGVEPFIHRCLESVFRYTRQWEELTERLGFWIHLDEAYVTYHQSYVESVWWALKTLFDRGLLYQGHKIVWWWPQGGTALSSGEVGQGYREVADPSVYVRFPLVDPQVRSAGFSRESAAAPPKGGTTNDEGGTTSGEELRDADLLVWTTTPWTLPSNQFVAVKPDLEYAIVAVEDDPRKLIIASALVASIAQKIGRTCTVVATRSGRDLLGLRYLPPFGDYYRSAGETRGRLPRRRQPTRRLAGRGRGFRDHRHGHGRGPPGPGLRRSRLRRAPDRAGPVRRRRRPGVDLLGGPRRHLHQRDARFPGPQRETVRSRHHPPPARRGQTTAPGAVSPRLSLLLACRRGPANPVSPQELVHPHHAVQGADAGQQPRDPLAARTHPRWPLWQFPRNQCRLGPLPRAVLGHAAADLGLRKDGLRGGGGQLRRTASQARRLRHRGLGSSQAGQSFAVRGSEGPQAVHRRGHLRLAQGARQADAPRERGDRLLVRLRGHALCPMGLSAPGGLLSAVDGAVSGRLHQRSHRPDARMVLQPVGDQHPAIQPRRRGRRQ